RAGLNRFVWDMHHPDADFVEGAVFWGGNAGGPAVSPGTYEVQLTTPAGRQTQRFEVRADPRVTATQADLDAQYELLRQIHDALKASHAAVNSSRQVKEQVTEWQRRAAGSRAADRIDTAGQDLAAKVTDIEEALIQVEATAFEDTLNYPIRLNNKFASLA